MHKVLNLKIWNHHRNWVYRENKLKALVNYRISQIWDMFQVWINISNNPSENHNKRLPQRFPNCQNRRWASQEEA